MKTKKLRIILLAFGAVFFSSCTNLLYTSLDVLRPAKVAFALDASNLLIVNNTVIQPANYGHTTQLLNETPKNVIISNDSLAIFCLGALAEDLEGKNFFSSVQLIPNTLNTSTEFFKPAELSNETVQKLCQKNHANAILSLDNIKLNDDLLEMYLPESSTFLASLEVKYETSWSIHYPNRSEPTLVHFKDTLYWEFESFYRKQVMSRLPKRTDALIDGALEAGHASVNRFVPYWEKVDRYFFNPNDKLMKQGMDSVYVKNWKSAIDLWESVYTNNKNPWIQAQAANNIAIAYEITGDIDKALEYATKSQYTFGEVTFVDYNSFLRLSNYIVELNQRKKEIDSLKMQVGE